MPSALNWTIWLTVSQVPMRALRPWEVGPLLLPGFVSIVSPTLIGHVVRSPEISFEYALAPFGSGQF